jgi:hypothetical protein
MQMKICLSVKLLLCAIVMLGFLTPQKSYAQG